MRFSQNVVPLFWSISVDTSPLIIDPVRTTGSLDVFPQEDVRRPQLSADRREPPRRRSGSPAGDRDAWAFRGASGERAVGAAVALGRALCREGNGAWRDPGRCSADRDGAAHWAGAGVRATVGRDRLPGGDRGACGRAQAWLRA